MPDASYLSYNGRGAGKSKQTKRQVITCNDKRKGDINVQPLIVIFNINEKHHRKPCGGCRAWLKAMDSESISVGIRRFKSGPPHFAH